MTEAAVAAPDFAWSDAVMAAALFAVDPSGTGGVALRGLPGPARDAWLGLLRAALPPGAPFRRVPIQIPDGRLLGGLDLAATLQVGRPIAERGLLAEADGGVILLAMAERLGPGMAARLGAVLDRGEVVVERDGLALRVPTRFGVVALDEGLEAEERPPAALLDRLAFHLDLTGLRVTMPVGPDAAAIAAARERLPGVTADAAMVEALCATAMALGIGSLRVPLLALQVARAAAALAGLPAVGEAEAALAARLVFAPRALTMPAPAEAPAPEPPPPAEDRGEDPADAAPEHECAEGQASLEDILLAATQAAIPAGLLSQLKLAGQAPSRGAAQGRAGALQHSARRGRPIGTRPGALGAGARLNLVETLRAAAPWQRLRRAEAKAGNGALQTAIDLAPAAPARIQVRRDDFRITRFRQRSETTTIFVVDASGSAALHRLAEAKGAVELLLADCYVRRDRVALIAFRGTAAELLLPPTASLLRAKRSLAGLPGGGGTPLAAAIDAAGALADQVRRQGRTPVVVFLTDGRGNVARDGTPGRTRAAEEAMGAARGLRAARLTALLVDTSPRPQPLAQALATEMGARCLPLPQADAATLNLAIRAVANP